MSSRATGLALILGTSLAATLIAVDAVAEEQVAEIIAVHVRDQGHPCGKAESAKRDEEASRPDEEAWILTCSNAVYRVRLIPDMDAEIEPLE